MNTTIQASACVVFLLLAKASHVVNPSVNLEEAARDISNAEATHQNHSSFLSLPFRMTLYVGKEEAGFYVSKALVHTGVALVVRRGGVSLCGMQRGIEQERGLFHTWLSIFCHSPVD